MCHIYSKSLFILNRIDWKYRLIFIFHVFNLILSFSFIFNISIFSISKQVFVHTTISRGRFFVAVFRERLSLIVRNVYAPSWAFLRRWRQVQMGMFWHAVQLQTVPIVHWRHNPRVVLAAYLFLVSSFQRMEVRRMGKGFCRHLGDYSVVA